MSLDAPWNDTENHRLEKATLKVTSPFGTDRLHSVQIGCTRAFRRKASCLTRGLSAARCGEDHLEAWRLWKRQYLEEFKGQPPAEGTKAFALDQRRIQELEKQLWRAKRDNEILKKASALFIRDSKAFS